MVFGIIATVCIGIHGFEMPLWMMWLHIWCQEQAVGLHLRKWQEVGHIFGRFKKTSLIFTYGLVSCLKHGIPIESTVSFSNDLVTPKDA